MDWVRTNIGAQRLHSALQIVLGGSSDSGRYVGELVDQRPYDERPLFGFLWEDAWVLSRRLTCGVNIAVFFKSGGSRGMSGAGCQAAGKRSKIIVSVFCKFLKMFGGLVTITYCRNIFLNSVHVSVATIGRRSRRACVFETFFSLFLFSTIFLFGMYLPFF